MRRYKETNSSIMKTAYEKLMTNAVCPECHGKRLKKEALSVTINNKTIETRHWSTGRCRVIIFVPHPQKAKFQK